MKFLVKFNFGGPWAPPWGPQGPQGSIWKKYEKHAFLRFLLMLDLCFVINVILTL